MKLIHQLRQLFTNSLPPVPKLTLPPPTPSTIQDTFAQEITSALQNHYPSLLIQTSYNHLHINSLNLEINCLVGERNQHPHAVIFGLEVRIFNEHYFPGGIVDCLAGIGEDDATAIAKGAVNHVDGVLLTIIQALSASHAAELDFEDSQTGKKWHPILGLLQVQGA
ncbi:hypothetical protein E4631_10125 [Hymenobacter sp. UV11]|nr:hypothetical protein A8B98_14420 [Hymenobacter sp. UV11]TFZ66370.1 hypothetical protein E4631_10125 [Hymenobacter sp. UV11]